MRKLTKTQNWLIRELIRDFKARLRWMESVEDADEYVKLAIEDENDLNRVWQRLTEDEQQEVIGQVHNYHFTDGPYPEDFVYMPWE